MQNGFFWYWAPMMTSGAPFRIAALVMSGEEMPTSALPAATTESWLTFGPPAIRLTALKPAVLVVALGVGDVLRPRTRRS